ncbi:ankyrin repeat domain-containing protein [Gloeocapsa sp. PCC 73106]|uniref:ankyrin repeat domain-containing protein n=1 Tax=Gloeocapsa sp. PCC 73106 TaxID=102232 RepID=UPI0002ABCCC5|nr:ankyrin repeat domain-containing protein [Gloeocapsa sp. PCC 73106]ELR98757.1 ketosteroid isomerase-like protein [Gloeocapsa sp. PCC 73106]
MNQEETRKVAQKWFDALDRGDLDTAISCLADDIEWVNLPKIPGVSDIIPWIGTAHGIAEVLQQFSTRNGVVEVKVFKPVDLVVEGNIAVGTVHDISTILATGLDFEILFASWMEVENGKITKWKSYCDPSPIVAAFKGNLPERIVAGVKDNNVEQVKQVLKLGADPNTRDSTTGLTVLMMAACQANPELVKVLLSAGADVFTGDSYTGATALHKTCQGGSVEIAQMLLDHGAHLDAVTPSMGHTPIMDALWYKWPDLVKLLVDRGQNLYFGTHYGFRLEDHIDFELNVNQGEEKKKFEIIKEIIDQGKARDQTMIAEQPVMEATNKGDLEAVKELIAQSADVNTVYPHMDSFLDGHTPLLVAARDSHTEIVEELLQAGAKVRVQDWVFKGAPIHKATYNGNPEILKLLVAHPDIDLDVQGKINGYTPLHDALWHGFVDCAEILVNAGARLDLRGHDGKLPLDIAIEVCGSDSAIANLIRSKF